MIGDYNEGSEIEREEHCKWLRKTFREGILGGETTCRYICIKGFKIPYFDKHMSITDRYGEIVKDSLWEISNDISESDIRLNKVGGFADFDYIDIPNERFKGNFVLLN